MVGSIDEVEIDDAWREGDQNVGFGSGDWTFRVRPIAGEGWLSVVQSWETTCKPIIAKLLVARLLQEHFVEVGQQNGLDLASGGTAQPVSIEHNAGSAVFCTCLKGTIGSI
jgi:hypothetical protein